MPTADANREGLRLTQSIVHDKMLFAFNKEALAATFFSLTEEEKRRNR